MKKAWIENDIVLDICPSSPSECYHPDIATHYSTDIPEDIVNGATLVDGRWINPELPTSVEPIHPEITVSPVEFKLLWLPQERAAIKGMRATDPIVDDFYDIVEDPRLTHVNMSLQSTQQAVDYLLAKLFDASIITSDNVSIRRSAILSGQFL